MNTLIYYNIKYGEHPRHRLDLALPVNAKGKINLILFIHGGGWIAGDKDLYQSELEYWTGKGYIAASINYRYVDDTVSHHDELDDITAALNKIKKRCNSLEIFPEKALLTGVSAGGHLSMLYGYSKIEEAPIKPVCIIDNCGPADLSHNDAIHAEGLGTVDENCNLFSWCCGKKFNKETFENEDVQTALKQVSPLYYINEKTIPTVISHGLLDRIVPYSQAALLDERLTACGVEHELICFSHSMHPPCNDPDCSARERQLFKEYAEKYLKT